MSGTALTQLRAGSGEPLLLVHGIGSTWRDWKPVLPLLSPSLDVLAVTLPGHLGGPPLEGHARPTLRALADALERELDLQGLRSAHVAGSSMGGWLALELARRGRARSVVAFAPAGVASADDLVRLRRRLLRNLALVRVIAPWLGVIGWSAAASRLLLAGSVQNPRTIDPEEAIHKMRAFAGCRGLRDLALDLCAQSRPAPFAAPVPVVVAWGDRDRVVPARCAQAVLEAFPGAEYRRLRGAGHLPMWDDPGGTAALILDATARGARPRAV